VKAKISRGIKLIPKLRLIPEKIPVYASAGHNSEIPGLRDSVGNCFNLKVIITVFTIKYRI